MNSIIPVAVLTKIPNLLKHLKLALPNVTFLEFQHDEELLKQTHEIIICDPTEIHLIIDKIPETKWLQTTWAGVEAFINNIKPSPQLPMITRYSGDRFGKIMVEYVIASIFNHERDNDTMREHQKRKFWTKDDRIGQYRIIGDLNIGIMGVGNIGSYIGRTLNNLGATVFGYGRRKSVDMTAGKNKYLTKYYPQDQLSQFLSQCDYFVNVLPSTDVTKGLLNGDVLKHCEDRQAIFINIGRGTVVSDDSILNAVQKKWISAAILDVFNEEPLPQNNPLWSTPNIYITPHVSGMSRPQDMAEQFSENYELYLKNEPIPTVLHLDRGY